MQILTLVVLVDKKHDNQFQISSAKVTTNKIPNVQVYKHKAIYRYTI